MLFLKAVTIDGEIEFFNTQNILTIQPMQDGKITKILMGAGLFWKVKTDTVELITLQSLFE